MRGRKMKRDRFVRVEVGLWELGESWQNGRLKDEIARGTTKLLLGIGQERVERKKGLNIPVTIAALCHLSLLQYNYFGQMKHPH